jgi:glycosyltransferase involved in cell wall biosynthesis
MTKVVILQEYIPQYRVAFFDHLVENAAKKGIDVVVAAGLPHKTQASRGDSANPPYLISIPQLELRLRGRRLVLRSILKATQGADLIILEQARRNLDVYLIFIPRFLRRVPYALWGHGRDYVEKRSHFSTWLQSRITTRCDWFFAYTPGGSQYVASLPFPQEKITTVMNAVDTAELKDRIRTVTGSQISDFRERWHIEDRVVSFVGALDESKRIPFLLDSIRIINAKHPDVSYVIAGDGPLRDNLIEKASDLPNVHFVGRADAKMKYLLLALSEVLAVPGRVGLIAVDSLAAGVPIATTDWSFHAPEFEYLVGDVTSVITTDSIQEYAGAMENLLSDDLLRARLAQNSLKAGEQLSIEKMSEYFLGGITGALNRGVAK